MQHTKALLALAAAAATIVQSGLAQELDRHEVAVQAFGSFVSDNTKDGVTHNVTNSGGVLGSYRFFFNANHGVEANYGYSRNTQSYSGTSGTLGVRSDSHEVSGAYVFRYPLKRFKPFALAGVAALIFDPVALPSVDSQTRAAFVYGGGADFDFGRRLYFRAEYRGFVYNSPNYDIPSAPGLSIVDRTTHRAEPSAGFGVRF